MVSLATIRTLSGLKGHTVVRVPSQQNLSFPEAKCLPASTKKSSEFEGIQRASLAAKHENKSHYSSSLGIWNFSVPWLDLWVSSVNFMHNFLYTSMCMGRRGKGLEILLTNSQESSAQLSCWCFPHCFIFSRLFLCPVSHAHGPPLNSMRLWEPVPVNEGSLPFYPSLHSSTSLLSLKLWKPVGIAWKCRREFKSMDKCPVTKLPTGLFQEAFCRDHL